MITFIVRHISSLSILIPAIAAFVRFRKLDESYLPFLVFIWAGMLNEAVSITLSYTIRNNILSNNIWFLLEFSLILWQFHRWQLFDRNKKLFYGIIILLSTIWTVDNFFIESIFKRFCSYFIIASSYTIVLTSISMINRLIVQEKEIVWKNVSFIICGGFLLFYSISILTESFYKYGFKAFPGLSSGVFEILRRINIITNLIYFVAILWMPTKRKFILQS